jgi:hypothetical protein
VPQLRVQPRRGCHHVLHTFVLLVLPKRDDGDLPNSDAEHCQMLQQPLPVSKGFGFSRQRVRRVHG